MVSRSITSLNVSIEEEDELRTPDPPSLSGILSQDWQRATSLLEGAASLIAPISLAWFPRVGHLFIRSLYGVATHSAHLCFSRCEHLQDVRVATGVEWGGWWVSDLVDDVFGDFN